MSEVPAQPRQITRPLRLTVVAFFTAWAGLLILKVLTDLYTLPAWEPIAWSKSILATAIFAAVASVLGIGGGLAQQFGGRRRKPLLSVITASYALLFIAIAGGIFLGDSGNVVWVLEGLAFVVAFMALGAAAFLMWCVWGWYRYVCERRFGFNSERVVRRGLLAIAIALLATNAVTAVHLAKARWWDLSWTKSELESTARSAGRMAAEIDFNEGRLRIWHSVDEGDIAPTGEMEGGLEVWAWTRYRMIPGSAARSDNYVAAYNERMRYMYSEPAKHIENLIDHPLKAAADNNPPAPTDDE